MDNYKITSSLEGKATLVLGGDGFCGWPTALRFSSLGAKVIIVDNGARRAADRELGTSSLTSIRSLDTRTAAWSALTGAQIRCENIDIARAYPALLELLVEVRPEVIIHFAEQRSAPYSMMSSKGARYSVDNNICATHNLLAALAEAKLDPHLMHLGTIGVYGYTTAGLKLPEGYLQITAHGCDGREVDSEILYPGRPDSIYHLTKGLDQQLFAFYTRFHSLRITDLHQGIVWGTQTTETRRDPRLVNRFDYDPIYGTVVNRFVAQAINGRPLSVYGSGEQTRGFIHIEDMLSCLVLAATTPPARGDRVRILNQISETSSLNALATRVAQLTGAEVVHVDNPRREPDSNEFDVDRSGLHDLGFVAHRLNDNLASEISSLRALLTPPDNFAKCTCDARVSITEGESIRAGSQDHRD